jgi:dinuclear metal center YbgI/SA1388 family protein
MGAVGNLASMTSETPSLREVVSILDALYDPRLADDWDAVGTVTGDDDRPISRVMFAVDPVGAIVEEAIDWGAELLVVHHPLLLRPVSSVAARTPKGRVIHRLIENRVALHVCHTNADSPALGVSDSLATALSITSTRPIVPATAPALDKLVTFVPSTEAEAVIDALASAGAGRLGEYERCAFTSAGVGTFRPGTGAHPTIGAAGEVARVEETRVEMVLDRRRRHEVLTALRASHPYEEPAFDLLEMAALPADWGSGRIGRLTPPKTLHEFGADVAQRLPATAQGVRVCGEPDRRVETVAVCGGAGDFLLDAVRASSADAFVTSDLRHHPASEFREHLGSPALVDVSHWAAESTWLPVAEAAMRKALLERGATVETHVSSVATDPWTFHVGPDHGRGS